MKGVPPLVEEVKNAEGQRVLRLNFHPGQLKAWNSEARFVLVLAGTQGGKTTFGPHWLAREIQRCGDGDYLAATASYDLLKLKMLPALSDLFVGRMGWKYHAGDRVIYNPQNTRRIILRSMEAEGGLESATARAAWLDECGQARVDVRAWEAVQRRLSIHQGRALLTTTPYEWNWLKVLHDRAVAGDPDFEVVRFTSKDNPAFPDREYYRAKKTMPEWRFRMFYDAEFTLPAGRIWPLDPSVHIVKPFTIPPDWHRIVGVDPGTTTGAVVWLAVEPASGVAYAYREWSGPGLDAERLAHRILEYGESYLYVLGGSPNEDDYRTRLALHGLPIVAPWVASVEAGIDRVFALFRLKRLLIFETLHTLIGQVSRYSRELDAAGEPTERIADRHSFHLCDALRYACCGVPMRGEVKPGPRPEPSPRSLPVEEDKVDEMTEFV